MKILFENSDWVAVQKPAGWLSVPSTQGKADPRPVVGLELQKQLSTKIYPLHRLDLEVSGVLAFAKSALVQKKILDLWNQGKVQKVYRALTSPQDFSHWPDSVPGKVERELQENPWISLLVAGKKRAFVAPHGMKSVTKWKRLSETEDCIEWELEPVTGRRHQLRVELSRRGFPIWGDQLYGSSIQGPSQQIALRAVSLSIEGYPTVLVEGDWESWKVK